jgi:Glycosyl transferases group 1
MRDAYRRIGVDVRTIGPAFGAEIWGMKFPPEQAWEPDGAIDAYWPDWVPDLIVFSKDRPFFFNPRHAGIPRVVHVVDNHVMDFRQEGIDHYFLGHLNPSIMPMNSADTTWLPCGYDPVVFTPGPIPWNQRQFDVSLVGAPHAPRMELLQTLAQAGLKVCAGMGAIFEDFRNIYHNTRISLCLSVRGDVAQRVFETAAMGCAILSDPCLDFARLKAQGITFFDDKVQALEQAKRLLADPPLAESLIKQSAEWVKPHTWDSRAQSIVQWAMDRAANPFR